MLGKGDLCRGEGCDCEGVGSGTGMREGGECSGDRVEDRSAGSILRRDLDTRGVREREGRLGVW